MLRIPQVSLHKEKAIVFLNLYLIVKIVHTLLVYLNILFKKLNVI